MVGFSRYQHVDQHHVPPGPGRPLPLQVGSPPPSYPKVVPTLVLADGGGGSNRWDAAALINPAGRKINSGCDWKMAEMN